MALQWVFFTCQSSFVAYLTGVHSGVEAAAFEKRLPLVDVRTVGGETITGLHMKSASAAEYRFVGVDGAERLIPAAHVQMVTAVTAADSAEPAGTD